MLFYSIVNEQFFSVSRLSFYFTPEAGAKNNFLIFEKWTKKPLFRAAWYDQKIG